MSLNNLGIRRSDFGRSEDALKATEEAATLYRELVARNGDAFLQELAMSLTNLGGDLFKLGRLDEALQATEEAVGLRRGLVAENRDAFLPDLARSRALQGNILLASARVPESIDAYAEAVRLLKPLADTKPQAFASLWLAILQNLIRALQTAARSEAEIRSTLVMLGVQRGGAGGLFSAVSLFQAWADAHNAGRDDEADAAYAALRVTLDENKENPDLDLIHNAVDATLARLGHPQRYEAVLKKRSRGMSTDNGI